MISVAASGWVSCSFPGQILAVGKYRVVVYNEAATSVGGNPKQLNCWDTGAGQNGITNAPLSAPSLAHAAPATIY